ncbi:MAG: hypothetical protein WC058_02805 [Phycisphaeraceae bacterium]
MTDDQIESLSEPQLIALVREPLARLGRLEVRVAGLEAENARLPFMIAEGIVGICST